MIEKVPLLNEKKCAYCGKKFIAAPEHSYVNRSGERITTYFCKYTCMLRYREELQAKRKRRKRGSDID